VNYEWNIFDLRLRVFLKKTLVYLTCVTSPDLQPELVHNRDEESNCFSDQLGRVALVVFNGDWSFFAYSLKGCRTIQPLKEIKYCHFKLSWLCNSLLILTLSNLYFLPYKWADLKQISASWQLWLALFGFLRTE